jgi:hypothetical protein
MKRAACILLASTALSFSAVAATATGASAEPMIWIQNNSDNHIIEHVYLAPDGSKYYDTDTDMLGDDVINPGDGEWIYPAYVKGCSYWVELALDNGHEVTSNQHRPVWACGDEGGSFILNPDQ